ncbi:DsbE family thiol:disulfide interchange protein [Ectothiorhodospiraceae bacterium BW-2]|nr:DsbE family thiol:disulfide interchange protein [Ectothiorhodospiraceae bacterium BW-2]
MNRYLLPLVIFIALSLLLAIGLKLNPREVPSPFIGKVAPAFTLPQLHQAEKSFDPVQMQGQIWLLNVWASWCVSCRAEHKVITYMAEVEGVTIIGLNYKDERGDAIRWLGQFGNPYLLSAHDLAGEVGIDWGVYGVPETFVIDREGVVRHKHIGPVTMESYRSQIKPLLEQLQQES